MGGWTQITNKTSSDIRWSNNNVEAADRGKVNGVNDINRDFVFGRNGAKRTTFNHKIKNGIWEVVMNMGDATTRHNNVSVKIENKTINNNVSNAPKQFPYVRANKVEVRDGSLTIEISKNGGGGDPSWVWNRLSLKRVGNLPNGSNNNSIPFGKYISLRKSGGDQAYVAAEDAKSQLIANRNQVGAWEKFLVERHPNGGIALKALANGKYVQVPNKSLTNAVTPKGNTRSTWERFEWKSMGNGKVAFKSIHTGKWLMANWNENGGIIRASGSAANIFETFNWKVESAAKNLNKEISAVLYPNPAISVITIDFADQETTNRKISIFNSVGQLLSSANTSNPSESIDVSKLSQGMYFAVISENGTVVRNMQFVKK